MISRIWKAFWRPSTKWGLGVLLVTGGIAGAVGWNGFHYVVEKTTTTEFCISCHSMRDNNYEEYKTTIHYQNTSGVRAECADCHVPKSGWKLYRAKLLAAKDLWGEIQGTIDTREKFEAHRLEMAETVWADMKANDSATCRTCHSFNAMDFAHQKPEASKQMQQAMNEGGTCIDCHKGIAHKMPDMASGYRALFSKLEKASQSLKPSKGETLYPLQTIEAYLEQPSGDKAKADGRLLAATPMQVVDVKGDWVQVAVKGWQQEGAERVIYEKQGKRIFNAALAPTATGSIVAGASMVDPDTEQTWTDVSLTAWVRNRDLTDDQEALWQYGKQMFNGACGMCHVLPHTEHFLANQWIGTLNAMKSRAPLDDEQFRLVQRYVQMHAKDVEPEGAAE
ncbi:pentaheme c-type cytochrome TorC [Cereibacter sphaeroides]|uniref:pentaheme c-type cytochrome TorC n=1 Tax=Cereibacter sphaeroides TaxID=1063 RepID=UPI000191CA9A|nr:pentaheme c-type cytochrome TorC [Cereibacter sphaeroides]ACM03077.1 DMSO/TMAO-cytochrome c-containing subunit [Cereibacter sphaeroides KD131]